MLWLCDFWGSIYTVEIKRIVTFGDMIFIMYREINQIHKNRT